MEMEIIIKLIVFVVGVCLVLCYIIIQSRELRLRKLKSAAGSKDQGYAPHLVVSTEKEVSFINIRSCTLEEIDENEFFETEKEAKIEVLCRERFNKKSVTLQ